MTIPHPLRTSCALLLTESRLWRTALRVALAVLGSIGPVPSVPAAEGMIEHTLSNGLQVILVEDHWHPLAALELLTDVVRHPFFPPAEVERARTAAIAELQAKTEETPEALLMRHLFAPGPYGRPRQRDSRRSPASRPHVPRPPAGGRDGGRERPTSEAVRPGLVPKKTLAVELSLRSERAIKRGPLPLLMLRRAIEKRSR